MSSLGWARATSSTADTLRRGAWYPIVEKTPDGRVVVVQVDNRPVRVSRVDVEVRADAPSMWCVVNRTGVMRPTFGGQTPLPRYAVCPSCRERQDFDGSPDKLTCKRCNKESPVDYSGAV